MILRICALHQVSHPPHLRRSEGATQQLLPPRRRKGIGRLEDGRAAAEPTVSQLSDQQMGAHIERIFRTHRRRYGYRRIVEELADQGHTCAPSRVRRIMAQSGLRAIAPKHFVPKTRDGRADCPSPNLLLDAPLPTQVNQVFAGDITFIPTSAGWLYLAVVIDLCSRKIIGWALADHLRSQLVIDALAQALGSRANTQNAIFHSDRRGGGGA